MKRTRSIGFGALAALVTFLTAQAAMGHPETHNVAHNALAAGALHPLLGLDHLLAAFASGLIAVRTGSRRGLWMVPLSFVALMLAGGALARYGVPLPAAEWGIALSVIVLGAAVALMPKIPLGVAAALVGIFAICHGHAHVEELAGSAIIPYMAGFVFTTAMIHAAAIGAGLLALRANYPNAIRFAGAAIAAAFVLVVA